MIGTNWPPDLAETQGSKYIVLIQSLRGAIRSGALESGSRLLPVREMAYQLGITPGTVARVYKMAAEEGLVETTVGRGTFVTGGPPADPLPTDPLVTAPKPGLLDFRGVRVPNFGQGAVIRDIMGQLSRRNGPSYTDYPNFETDLPARNEVVRWIGPDRVGRLEADDIVLGFGAQNAVMMALQTCLHGANPVIMTEALTYPGVRHAARLLRAQLVGIEMDDAGLRPDRLEEALRQHGGQVLLTAAHTHSPTTIFTTLERRQQIADIARRYQLQIIEDDCHCISRPDTPSYRSICPERAWYVSSLTKSVSAALRFGFIACPKSQAAQTRQIAQSSFYGMPQPVLDLCAELLRSHEAENIRANTEQRVLERVRLAVNILGQWDIRWRSDVPFIWMNLPQGWRGSTFTRACEGAGIRIKPADEFALPEGYAPHAVRIALNPKLTQAEFESALTRMSELLAQTPANIDL